MAEQENKPNFITEEDNCYCLPIIDNDWDEKDIDWTGKQFFRVNYKCRWFVPHENLEEKLFYAYKEIARRGYGLKPNGLHLYKNNFFKGELLVEIKNGEVKDPDVKTFMGYIHTKIYHGPVSDLTSVIKTFDFRPLNVYYAYFSCPVCAPEPRQQKTVLIGEKRIF